MSTRLNQEVLEVGVTKLASSGGNVRLNQEVLQIAVKNLTATGSGKGNTRLNQAALLLLTPVNLNALKIQLIGGPFQDALGNPLANGYLIMRLQHDAAAPFNAQIVGNMAVKIPLDANGYVQGTFTGAQIFIWPNDVLVPAGGTYLIWAYDANNRLAWDNPQVQQVLSTPNPYNVNNWVPGP